MSIIMSRFLTQMGSYLSVFVQLLLLQSQLLLLYYRVTNLIIRSDIGSCLLMMMVFRFSANKLPFNLNIKNALSHIGLWMTLYRPIRLSCYVVVLYFSTAELYCWSVVTRVWCHMGVMLYSTPTTIRKYSYNVTQSCDATDFKISSE